MNVKQAAIHYIKAHCNQRIPVRIVASTVRDLYVVVNHMPFPLLQRSNASADTWKYTQCVFGNGEVLSFKAIGNRCENFEIIAIKDEHMRVTT